MKVIHTQIGDDICDLNCMNQLCNFDAYFLINNEVGFTSDCEWNCIYSDCSLYKLADGICDEECNNAYCGYDLGDCSYCGPSCKYNVGNKTQLGGTCDEGCNVPECYYDMGACRECSAGCNTSIWGNGVCDEVCNNVDCNFDMGDCINSACAAGCNTWMVGNSICDEACYVEECEYDKTDCTCAPFCSDSLLKNGICDEVCNNLNCKFDNGDCGYCSSGCSDRMLANSICDLECDTKECEWDYYACGCAEGCRVDDYGSCKPECLVGTCNYDRMSSDPNKWCNDRDLVLFTIYQQMLLNDTNYVVYSEKCFSSSDYQCNLTMALDHNKCYRECFISECNYGLCGIDKYESCQISLPQSAWNLCNLCSMSSESLGVDSCSQCLNASISCTFLNLFDFHFYYSNYFPSFPHLSFYYVTSMKSNALPSGNGTLDFPYESLDYAISSIKSNYSVIYLKNDGLYELSLEHEELNDQYTKIKWKIVSYDRTDIMIKVNSWSHPHIYFSGILEMENLIFEGGRNFVGCYNSIYCSYCSYNTYNSADQHYYNDRGELISSILPNIYCEFMHESSTIYNYYPFIFCTFTSDLGEYAPCSLILRNVKFINFRTGYNSIITGFGHILLLNVDFDNIWINANENSAIIFITGETTSNADLTYIGGSVTRVNNGYEYGDPIDFPGFLKSQNVTSVLIRNVEFKYNLVYRKEGSELEMASLIYINTTNFIEIDNSTFMHNHCENGILNLGLTVSTYYEALNETYYIPYLYKDHIYVHDSKFLSNYGNHSLIDIQFYYYILNIHFENLTFESNGIEQGAAITIANPFMLDEYKNGVIRPYTLKSGRVVNAILGSRWCTMDNLSFIKNHGIGMINLFQMVNLSLKNIKIDSNGSPDEDWNINTLLLDFFIRNQDIYLKREMPHTKALDCEYMVSISNSYNVNISPTAITGNTCRNASPTYIVSSSDIADINSINCSGNKGNGALPICFLLTGNFPRVLENSLFEDNFNPYVAGVGAIKIEDSSSLNMKNCTFRGNIGNYGGSMNIASKMISINSSFFESNLSPYEYGGAIYYLQILSTGISLFEISSTEFKNNSAHYGGCIFIAQQWAGSLTEFLVLNSTFYLNSASYGSSLYIDSTVVLNDTSLIEYSKFIENNSKISSCVMIYNKGNLNFRHCDFLTNIGAVNSALQININNATVTLDSCQFINNNGLSVILADSQYSASYIETRNCIFEYNHGSVIFLSYNFLNEKASIFRNNFASSGSCLKLQNSASAVSTSSYYSNNTSSDKGGVIFISYNSEFYCNSCNFTHNSAQTGGVLYSEQDSQFSILDSEFIKNSCDEDGSIIYAFNMNKESILNSCRAYENNSKNGGSVTLLNSKLALKYWLMYKNNGGFKLAISTLNIAHSKFSNQTCFQGCFIYQSIDSSTYIMNSSFSHGISSDSGGAVFSSSSSMRIELSEFTNISSLAPGGAIYTSFDSALIVKDSKFSSSHSLNIGGVLYAHKTPITIEKSIFKDYSKTGIYGSYLDSLRIYRSSFSKGNGRLSGGIYCYSCSDVKIGSSSFSNHEALVAGGSLYFDSDLKTSQTHPYEIYACSFIENSALNGGAIYANGLSLSVIMANFVDNKAISNKQFEDMKVDEGIGGAIKLSCLESFNCEFEIKSSNFSGNSATYNGGAISWDDWSPILTENYFTNNSARYGNDLSSYPVKLMSVNENGTLENYTNLRQLTDNPISNFNLSSVAPGQDNEKPIIVALVDSLNQIIETDNISIGELKSKNISTIITGATKVKAANGLFIFSLYEISDEPGSKVTIGIFSSAIDDNKKLKAKTTVFDQTLLINVNLRDCEFGEIKAGKKCEVCGQGYYSLGSNKTQCSACPSYAICFGNYTMVPKPGYWRDNAYTDKFWKCPNHNACLGSPDPKNLSYTGLCNIGYKGNMCQSCQSGFSRTSNSKCKECPTLAKNLVILISIAISLIILAFIMVKTSQKSALKPKKLTSVYIKILLNYLQMVILTSTFKLNWPNQVLEIFYIQSSTDYVYQQLYSFACFLDDESGRSLVFYRSLITISLLPVFMAFVALIIWCAVKLKQKSFKDFWDDYISTCIILLFLVHPSIVKKMFASFNCIEINSGEYWLEEDHDIRCWNDDHIFYTLTVSLPSIIFWGILLPTVCLINLIRNRNFLTEINVRLRYGFLFNGYDLKKYYWEFIIIYSKIVLICCSVFLTSIAIKMQALITAILLTLFLLLQYSNNPYIESNLNKMELQAKIVCVITIYSGLFYLTDALGEIAILFFFLIIVFINCYFLIYWSFHMFKELFCFVYTKAKSWRSRNKISCNSVIKLNNEINIKDSQEFNEHARVSINNEIPDINIDENDKIEPY